MAPHRRAPRLLSAIVGAALTIAPGALAAEPSPAPAAQQPPETALSPVALWPDPDPRSRDIEVCEWVRARPDHDGSIDDCTRVGQRCVVDLSACDASDEADEWSGRASLEGRLVVVGYNGGEGFACEADDVTQAWPLAGAEDWWCGAVIAPAPPPR